MSCLETRIEVEGNGSVDSWKALELVSRKMQDRAIRTMRTENPGHAADHQELGPGDGGNCSTAMSSATEARDTKGRDKGQKMAWGSARADDVVPPDENKPLADRILTLGPLTAAISATRRHPRFSDMILYVAFLALLTYVVMKAQDLDGAWPSSTPYLSARLIHQRYGDKFLKIETIGQWFDYMEQDLLPIIYPLAWYNGKEISKPDLGFAGAGRNSPDNFRIVGAVQVRQIRTQKSTCPRTFQQELRNLVLSCVGEYSKVTQEQVPYGPREKGQHRYSFTSSIENGENSYTGIFSTYDGGGYVTTLPADGSEETKNRTLAKIKQMRTDLWVDRQTRAIFVTVNLFNPTTGYITALRLMLEHPASGGLHPSVSMRHVPIGALYTSYAKLSLVLPEGLLTVAVIFYMFWEFNQASKVTFAQYFSHFWGIFDWINFVLFILAYSFRWAAYDKAKILNFPPINEKFVNFETSAWHVQMWRNTLAVNLIICYLKLFKYSSQIPSLAHLFKKIFFTMIDFFYVLLSFIFTYFGFALSHFLAYGDQIASCRTIPDTMVMLWKHMLGYLSPGVEEMVEANRFLGPLFFVVFTSTVSIVLLTYFLGLLRESYVLADDQNDRMGLMQSLLQSAIAPYLGLVEDYLLKNEETEAALDALKAQEALANQVEKEDDMKEKMMGWDPEFVQGRKEKARLKREARKDILLQSLLVLSRETRVISKRVDTLVDSDAPTAADLPDFFD